VTTVGGTLTTGAAGRINWLCDSATRAWHMLRPDHLWNRVISSLPSVNQSNALQVYNNYLLPNLQRLVNDPKTTKEVITLTNGATKIIYTGIINGQTVIVRIWLSPNGQQIVEDAFPLIKGG